MHHEKFGRPTNYDKNSKLVNAQFDKILRTKIATNYKSYDSLDNLLANTFLVNRDLQDSLFNEVKIYPLGHMPLEDFREFIAKFKFKIEVIEIISR
jgi:hypothetical protein